MFEAWDNDAWKDDGVVDSESLNRIRINQRYLWEHPPTQGVMRDKRDGIRWASLDFVCFKLIPFYIEPGMTAINVHFFAAATDLNADKGGWLRVCEGVVPSFNSARAQEQYLDSGLTDDYTLTIPISNTETSRFTFIQIWFKSESFAKGRYFPDGGISVPDAPGFYLYDDNQNGDGFHDNDFDGQAIYFINAEGVVVRQYDLMGYVNQGSAGSPDYAFQVHPEYRQPEWGDVYDDETYPATWYTSNVGNIAFFGVALEPTFDTAYLNTASPDILAGGSPTRASYKQLLLAGEDQIFRRRRFIGCLPPGKTAGNAWFTDPSTVPLREWPAARYNFSTTPEATPYTAMIPVNQHIGHNALAVVLLLTAFDYVNPANNRSSSPGKVFAEIKLELVEYEDGSGDPTVVSTETYIEQVPYFQGDSDSWLRYMKRWQFASRRAGLSVTDMGRLLDPNSFKLGTFRLEGVPFQSANIADQRLPRCLRVTITPNTSGLVEGSSAGARDYFLFDLMAPASAVFLERT